MTLELHETTTGEHVGLGLLDPEPDDGLLGAARGFSPMTLDEIRAELAGKPSQYGRREIFDRSWIANQQRTNACNGHASSRTLSRAYYLKTGEKLLLSGADAYSQMNGGRDQGSSLARGIQVVTAVEFIIPRELFSIS